MISSCSAFWGQEHKFESALEELETDDFLERGLSERQTQKRIFFLQYLH